MYVREFLFTIISIHIIIVDLCHCTYHWFVILILPEQQAGAEGTLKAGMAAAFVTSPLYPKKYFSNSKLSWIITAPRYSIITLEVTLLLTHSPSLSNYNRAKGVAVCVATDS